MSIYNISFSVKISFLVQHNRDGQSYLAYAFLKVVGLDNASLAQPTRELPVSYSRTNRRQGKISLSLSLYLLQLSHIGKYLGTLCPRFILQTMTPCSHPTSALTLEAVILGWCLNSNPGLADLAFIPHASVESGATQSSAGVIGMLRMPSPSCF